MNPFDFVEWFGNEQKEKVVQFAKVDPNYTTGRPFLIFDGEATISGKAYPYLSSFTPTANDRVMLVKGVIVGKIV